MNKQHAYIELTFDTKTKEYFNDLVNTTVPAENLYYSPVKEHIKGNVTKDLHMTIFFGLELSALIDPKLKALIDSTVLDPLKLGKIELVNGYQNLYKILRIEVLDDNNHLSDLAMNLKQFEYDKDVINTTFVPHITLAYVTFDFELPNPLPKLDNIMPQSIKISKTG